MQYTVLEVKQLRKIANSLRTADDPQEEDLFGTVVKHITHKEKNKLLMEQQLIKIACIENALQYQCAGKSYLWGGEISQATLTQARNDLQELDRIQRAYERENLPYFNSNGSSLVNKIKDHYSEQDGQLLFVEMIPGSTGKKVKVHMQSTGTISKQIKRQNMATKKKAAKKAATKKTATVAAKKKGPTIGSVVEGLVAKGKTNEQIIAHFKAKKIQASENSLKWYASKARAI